MPPEYPVSPQQVIFYPSLAPTHAPPPPPPFTAQVLRGGKNNNNFNTFVVPTQIPPQPNAGIYRLPDPNVPVVSRLTQPVPLLV